MISKLIIVKHKEVFHTKDEWKAKVLDELTPLFQTVPAWLSDNKLYTMDYIYTIIANQMDERTFLWGEEESLKYYRNMLLTYLPRFYTRYALIINDSIKDLVENVTKLGDKTSMKSKTTRKDSTEPYNNDASTEDVENVDRKSSTGYDLTTSNPNLIEQAKLLAGAKIGGEIRKFVGCFSELFARRDIAKDLILHKYDISGPQGAPGKDGAPGQPGQQGQPGQPGQDGKNGLSYIREFATTADWNNRPDKHVGDIGFIVGATAADNVLLLETTTGTKEYKDKVYTDWIKDRVENVENLAVVNENDIQAIISAIANVQIYKDTYANSPAGVLSNNDKTLTYSFQNVSGVSPQAGDVGFIVFEADPSLGIANFELPFQVDGDFHDDFSLDLNDKDVLTIGTLFTAATPSQFNFDIGITRQKGVFTNADKIKPIQVIMKSGVVVDLSDFLKRDGSNATPAMARRWGDATSSSTLFEVSRDLLVKLDDDNSVRIVRPYSLYPYGAIKFKSKGNEQTIKLDALGRLDLRNSGEITIGDQRLVRFTSDKLEINGPTGRIYLGRDSNGAVWVQTSDAGGQNESSKFKVNKKLVLIDSGTIIRNASHTLNHRLQHDVEYKYFIRVNSRNADAMSGSFVIPSGQYFEVHIYNEINSFDFYFTDTSALQDNGSFTGDCKFYLYEVK